MTEHAAIYLSQDKVDFDIIFVGTMVEINTETISHQYQTTINGESVKFNFMPNANLTEHLRGFIGYVTSLNDEPSIKNEAIRLIRQTKAVLGLEYNGAFNKNPDVWENLLKISELFDGFVFTYNSIYMPSGAVLIGPMKNGT